MESMPAPESPVTVGVDTHLDTHMAAVIDQAGRLLDTQPFPASTRGYVALVTWAEHFGPVECIGVEAPAPMGPAWPASPTPTASRSSRSTGPTAAPAGDTASRIRLMLRPPPGPPWPGWLRPRPRPARAKSR
jgi:hypothetical protein